jgi:putative ABC transport system ATP-binding protein
VAGGPEFGVRLENVDISWGAVDARWHYRDLAIDFATLNYRLPIVGLTGGGKSTLLYVLAAIKWADAGTITWQLPGEAPKVWQGDQDRRHRTRAWHALRTQHFGFTFQDGTLLPFLKVRENLEYPLLRAGRNKVQAAAEAASRLEKILVGDETVAAILAKFPRELSGGQRRRVALAKAMVRNPTVLFADEPTASLDACSRADVMTCVMAWLTEANHCKQRAVVWVTHDEQAPLMYDARSVLRIRPSDLNQSAPYKWEGPEETAAKRGKGGDR